MATHSSATSYHQPKWLEVIGAAFGHKTQYLVAKVDDQVVGVLPLVFFRSTLFGRFAVSLPFVNYGGLLSDGPGVDAALIASAIAHTRDAGGAYLELRHTRQHAPEELTPKYHKVGMELQLQATADTQWQALDRKVRNQVRKAEKSGAQCVQGGAERLHDFYTVFARNMRDLGTPVYDRRFFEHVLRAFPNESRVFVIVVQGKPVAASIVHWHGRRIEVPWASSLREMNALCPNVLLYWEMLRFAVERGFRTFDFGRSTPGEGTYHFKRQWGAEARPLVWEYWTKHGQPVPELNPKNPKFDFAVRCWQRLPVRIATTIGPAIVRNIP